MKPTNKKDAWIAKKYKELKDMLHSPDETYKDVAREIREQAKLYKKKRHKTNRQSVKDEIRKSIGEQYEE